MVKRNKLLIFILITITVLTIGCNENKNEKRTTEKTLLPTQLDLIQQRGKLIATTDYNSTNYFIYRGTP
ncbi:MAG: hypothetical protein EOL88_15700, partial [Bacteroidia bacterium]|nr:hypothetical protein [Bacteroidia bacterium]